ncbi:ABC transporter permease [Demequina sp. NBRC 110057]|uniref:ABC transporter permease n=1 Tax=Demequina sp. NBRC 110057 TaxID=1570346 RepID=UPI00117743EC|nr:ABC transporter permease [Demequina sp. NBRC 110057]
MTAPPEQIAPDPPRTSRGPRLAVPRRLVRPLAALAVPALAAGAALVIGAVMLIALGANPVEGYASLFTGAFGSVDALADTAIKSMPILLVAVGITIAFRAGVINIGGEGQIIVGALTATCVALWMPGLPSLLLVPLVILAGAVGGGIWGAIPGALKAYYNVSEILSTIMLNIVAAQLLSFLLQDLLMEEGDSHIQQTARLSENADLPMLPGDTRLHLGVVIAIVVAVLGYLLLFRSTLGVRLRAVGHNPDASRYAGMPVARSIVQAMAFSGACAGVAGALLVFGSQSHRLIGEGGAAAFTQSAGFNGIVAALFGGLHPLFSILSSFLFGGMLTGGIEMQRDMQVPSALIIALNGIIVIFVVASLKLRTRVEAWADRMTEER